MNRDPKSANPPPANLGIVGFSLESFPIPPKLSSPPLRAIVAPTVVAASNPATASFPYLPPRNPATFPAFPIPALANRTAVALASAAPPLMTIEIKPLANFPKEVPNIM